MEITIKYGLMLYNNIKNKNIGNIKYIGMYLLSLFLIFEKATNKDAKIYNEHTATVNTAAVPLTL